MTTFSQAVGASKRAPLLVRKLELGAFADSWPSRPKDGIAVGLRLLSAEDEQIARTQAARRSAEMEAGTSEEDRAATYNEELITWAVARAICDPNDVGAPHPILEFPEDQARQAFTSATLRALFDEIELLQITHSPVYVAASDADIDRLPGLLAGLAKLPRGRAQRARRLLRFVIDELEAG